MVRAGAVCSLRLKIFGGLPESRAKGANEKIDESSGTRCDKFSLALPTARKSPKKLFEGNDRLPDEAHERVKLQGGGSRGERGGVKEREKRSLDRGVMRAYWV